jgi:hypothetical protein
MALVKVYRAAYYFQDDDDAPMFFSEWVQAANIPDVEAKLAAQPEDMQISIVGWEEKTLDTEPV